VRILNERPRDPRDGLPVEIVYWFDHSPGQRSWVIYARDHAGQQVDHARYCHAKTDAVAVARDMAAEHHVKARHLKAGDP
jgi:hypothetical protein